MFRITNCRKKTEGEFTNLICDFQVTEIENPFTEETIWVSVEKKNADMLADNVLDAFVLIPLILGMYYHQDVHIDGNISRRLYYNIQHYLMRIFDCFSDRTKPIQFTVNGFDSVTPASETLIGTGISCGVDSLVTIFDNYVNESDQAFRINSLFFVNCGTHGDYESPESKRLFLERAKMNKESAKELGLPCFLVDSNIHAFTHKIGEQQIGYLAIYSCILSLQRYVHRYYTSSNYSYDEIGEFRNLSRDLDIAEYCESYMPHLISTENFELVIDGCQYTRAQKVERISEWGFAKKNLNVCVSPNDGAKNCSECHKCMWTMIPLEAMGKLDQFKEVFDLSTYYRKAPFYKTSFLAHEGKHGMESSIIRYAKEKGLPLSPKIVAKTKNFIYWRKQNVKKLFGTEDKKY
ncbi:MAG: hypothetical protein IJP92_12260 [Lachnospiraceae bacterium]|nr:hypothetical protein [Lachnospiraceae bacterium]